MSGWQPIESVPYWQLVLLVTKGETLVWIGGYFECKDGVPADDCLHVAYPISMQRLRQPQLDKWQVPAPTHWMPLPSAPQ